MALTHEQEKECATLKRLFSERSQLTQKEFAAKFGLGTPGNLWQYLNARRALNLDVAVKFATGLRIEVADFSPRLAEKQRNLYGANLAPVANAFKKIPLLSYVQAGLPHDGGQVPSARTAIETGDFVYGDPDTPDDYYALSVAGRSMEPDFAAGDIVIVDPSLLPSPGDIVVARRCDTASDTFETSLKKYRPRGYDESGRVIFDLSPINEDFPTLHSSRDKLDIIGVVVEHRRHLRNRR